MSIRQNKEIPIKVVLLDNIHQKAREFLSNVGFNNISEEIFSFNDLGQSKLRDIEILGIRTRTKITEQVLQKMPNLISIGSFSVGTNHIDLEACRKRGIAVFNGPHASTRSVAEMVIGQTITLMRSLFTKSMAAHSGVWLKDCNNTHEIRGKTIGIIGYGNIGVQVSILAEALGMKVIFYDQFDKLPVGSASRVQSIDEVLAQSDVVTIHVNSMEGEAAIDMEAFTKMKPGAFLINTSRAWLIDTDALVVALNSGHLGGAAIDVFPDEPHSKSELFESPLRGISNCILTPHIGGSSKEAQAEISREVSEKLARYYLYGNSLGALSLPEIHISACDTAQRIFHMHTNNNEAIDCINKAIWHPGNNVTNESIGANTCMRYAIYDFEKRIDKRMLFKLKNIPGTINLRLLDF